MRYGCRPRHLFPLALLRTESYAWAENLDEGKSGCADRIGDDVGGAVRIARECARDEIGSRGERDHQRMEDLQAGAARGKFRIPVGFGGGRRLALGHAVHMVVHDDVGQVDVAPASMQKVVAADGVAVAVAARHHDREVGPRQLQPARRGERAPVHAVKSVAGGVGRDARGAADAGDDGDVLRPQIELGERLGE